MLYPQYSKPPINAMPAVVFNPAQMTREARAKIGSSTPTSSPAGASSGLPPGGGGAAPDALAAQKGRAKGAHRERARDGAGNAW